MLGQVDKELTDSYALTAQLSAENLRLQGEFLVKCLGQQKVPILKKTTGLCSSRSYYSMRRSHCLASVADPGRFNADRDPIFFILHDADSED